MRALGLIALLATFAGGCVRVDATVQGLVQDAGQSKFPGAGAAGGTEMSMTNSFTLSTNNSLVNDVVSAKVQSIKLTPTSGVTSLDFFRQVDIVAKADGAADLPLISAGPADLVPAADGTLTLPVNLNFDPATYLKQTTTVDATIDMMAPADDWSLGITMTLTMEGGTTIKL